MDRMQEMFIRQAHYLASLKPIYDRNGIHLPLYPLDLNDRYAQEHFRLLAWRITEELIETLESPLSKKAEEISDVLHFIIELALATGITYAGLSREFEQVRSPQRSLEEIFPETVITLADAMMYLRQRPWRTDVRMTEFLVWEASYERFFRAFLNFAALSGVGPDQLYKAFFEKGKINDQRTREQTL